MWLLSEKSWNFVVLNDRCRYLVESMARHIKVITNKLYPIKYYHFILNILYLCYLATFCSFILKFDLSRKDFQLGTMLQLLQV